jgi:hypothetical protein
MLLLMLLLGVCLPEVLGMLVLLLLLLLGC